MSVTHLDQEIEVASAAARIMGSKALSYYGKQELEVSFKGNPSNPVSVADREAQTAGLDLIRGSFPEDGFIGEEDLDAVSSSGRYWILDPIDGTIAFLHRQHQGWGCMVSLVGVDKETLVSAVFMPATDDIYLASPGLTTGNGKRITLGKEKSLAAAHISTSINPDRQLMYPNFAPALFSTADLVHNGVGSAASAARILEGTLDANIVHAQNVWDYTPIQHLIAEAGGCSLEHGNARITASSEALAAELKHLVEVS